MVDIKALLTKMNDRFKNPTLPIYTKSIASNSVTTGSWYKPSDLTISSNWYWTNDLTRFANDTNGVKVLKSGTYLVILNAHLNGAASTSYMTKFYNYTTSTDVGGARYLAMPTGVSFGEILNTAEIALNANDILIAEFGRYGGSGTLRMNNMYMHVLLLSP